MKHGRPEWDDVIAVADLSLDWASDRRGWRRCRSQMVWQAVQAVVYVACLDEAHDRYNHENWVALGEWDSDSPACDACNALGAVRFHRK